MSTIATRSSRQSRLLISCPRSRIYNTSMQGSMLVQLLLSAHVLLDMVTSSQSHWILLVPSRASLVTLDAALGCSPADVAGLPRCPLQFARLRNAFCLSFGRIHLIWQGLLPRLCPRYTLLLLPARASLLGSSLFAGMGRACAALQVHTPLVLITKLPCWASCPVLPLGVVLCSTAEKTDHLGTGT